MLNKAHAAKITGPFMSHPVWRENRDLHDKVKFNPIIGDYPYYNIGEDSPQIFLDLWKELFGEKVEDPRPDEEIEIVATAPKEPKKVEDMNVYEFYGFRKRNGIFGLEIEVEGANLPMIESKVWKQERDNSLRNDKGDSWEYVLKNPLEYDKVEEALDELAKAFKDSKAKPFFSYRTSVHAHVNVQEFTKPQLSTFLYLSHLFENALVEYCGEVRAGNRFCLRSEDAEAQVENLENFIMKKGFNIPNKNVCKYAAINIAPVAEYGSVEFRSMRGTIDKKVLLPWITMLNELREASLKFNSPKEVAQKIQEDGFLGLFTFVFSKASQKLLKYPNLEHDVEYAYSRMLNIPFKAAA